MTPPLITPSPYSEIIDSICAQDRLFFEANADAREYTRAYVHGEFWPMVCTNCQLVKVRYIAVGLRLRMPILAEGSLN